MMRSRIASLARIAGEYWPFLLPVLLFLPGLDSFVFPGSGAAFSDLAVTHYPNALFLQRSLSQGVVPLWSPQILSGFPFVAHPFSGIWYPPYWLALLFPLPLGLNLVLMVHLVWAGVGMYVFLARQGLPRPTALLGGLAFEAMPKLFAHVGAGHLMLVLAVCWLPWLLATGSRLPASRWPRLAQPAVVLALVFCADPRWAVYAGGLWAAWQLAQRRQVRWAAGQVLLAALLALPAVWLYAEYGSLSTRSALTAAEVLQLSLPPASLLGLLVPQWGGFHEWLLYPGLVVLLLALVSRPWQAGKRFWLGLFLLALIISLGEAIPGAQVAAQLPGLSQLRIPPRALLLAGFALCVLAAYGLQALLQAQPAFRGPRLLFAGLLAFFILTLAVALWPPLLWAAAVLLIATALLELRIRRRISAQQFARALCALALADLLLIDASLLRFRSPEAVLGEGGEFAETLALDPHVFRVYSPSYSIPQQTAAQYGFQLAAGVDPLQLQAYADFIQEASGVPQDGYSVSLPSMASDPARANFAAVPDAELLGLLNVRYVVSAFPIVAPGLREVRRGSGHLYINQAYRPPAWVQDGEEVRTADVLARESNSIVVTAAGPGQLVFSEVAYPGWQASLDRAPTTLGVYAGLLRAVDLPAGEHEVELHFRPAGLTIGLPLALAAWVGLLAWPPRAGRTHRLE